MKTTYRSWSISIVVSLALVVSGRVDGQDPLHLSLIAQVEHPFETNDIWGYVAPDGTEYAVVGTERDCRIYSLADPSAPLLVATIPGATSIWRDFKSYDQYIYQITQRGRDGLTIIDMTSAPDTVTFTRYTPTLTVDDDTDELTTCHNLYIDEDRGRAYLAGCNLDDGGVLIFDIKTDPLQPIYLGAADERYSHDVVTRGDTLFSSEINQGFLGIYDISDPSAPSLLSRTRTSSSFTHNAWYSDDGRYVYTTDERANAYVDAYDITTIESPTRIDQYRPVPDGGGVIPHNTHYYKGYLVTSWYVEGVVILDAHRPHNLVKVGQYDTYTGTASGFNGCWGAYPYLPSGLLLASDLSGGLFVFEPEYIRAAYLEGTISDAISGSPINGATITLSDPDATSETSIADGSFATGTVSEGTISVIISHPDYDSDTLEVMLTRGEVTMVDVRLMRTMEVFSITGPVVDTDGQPIEQAKLIISGPQRSEALSTNRDGFYRTLISEGTYDIYVAAWGYKGRRLTRNIDQALQDPIVLEAGYEDDFFVDLGWTDTSLAATGNWVREVPRPTSFEGSFANPNADVPDDLNDYAYITGNNNVSVGADDVDNGTTTLLSPPIDIRDYTNPIIEVTPWFFNDGGESTPNDSMVFRLHLDLGGTPTVHTFVGKDDNTNGWGSPIKIYVDSIAKRARVVRLEVARSDDEAMGHLVEGGIDKFRVYEGPAPTYPSDQKEIEVVIAPNPTAGLIYIDVFTDVTVRQVNIYDMTGGRRAVFSAHGTDAYDLSHLASGVYIAEVIFDSGVRSSRKFRLIQE